MNTLAAPYDEAATTEELVFALAQRDQPTVAFIECASLAKRNELETLLAACLPEYQFHTIDVTPFPVVSLLRTLGEQLPAAVRESAPVSYVVNVHGLENSLLISQDGQLVPSLLTAQLNLERELLFHNVLYIIILWGDAHFFRTLQREAPDLWHWVTYHFRFEDHTARSVEALPPLPPERLPQRGNIAERQARITELEDRYAHLLLDSSDKRRLLKDKIDMLSLLAAEYVEAFLYREAEQAYNTAIALQKIVRADKNSQRRLLFELGKLYFLQKRFSESIDKFEQSKKFASPNNFGNIYFQIGKIYARKGRFLNSLKNYQLSLECAQRTKDIQEFGSIYHQIGVLYQSQKKWQLALINFHLAQKWYMNTIAMSSQPQGLSFTYHHIGMVYAKNKQWVLALESYQKSILLKKQIKIYFYLGSTYLMIGKLYHEQNKLDLARENYQQAITWSRETSNDYEIGASYMCMGALCIDEEELMDAIEWLEEAIKNFICHANPLLLEAEKALLLVQEKLQN